MANATNCQTRALTNYTVVRMRQGLFGGGQGTRLSVKEKWRNVRRKDLWARDVVDVKKVDCNCHLVRCYVPRLSPQKPGGFT